MHIETASYVKNNLGAVIDAALREPVAIQRSGRNTVVMIAYEDYEALVALSDRYWAERALQAEKSGFIGKKESEDFLQEMLNRA